MEPAHQSITGSITQPDEVAELVVFLAGEQTANVSGAEITIDGGLIPTW
jgi:NAD(P)-dependent dehydrogenase (short-subunit alcohol dehydrogenase family)